MTVQCLYRYKSINFSRLIPRAATTMDTASKTGLIAGGVVILVVAMVVVGATFIYISRRKRLLNTEPSHAVNGVSS